MDGVTYYIDHANQNTTFEHPSRTMMEHLPSRNPPHNPPHNSGHASHRSPPQSPSQPSAKRQTAKQRAPSSTRTQASRVIKRGWLHTHEATSLSKSWKRRWAVLADFAIFFYKNEEEKGALHSVLLPSYKINHCDRSDPVNRIFSFKLEHENTKTDYLAADTRDDLEHWMAILRQAAAMQGPVWENNNSTFKGDQPKLLPKSPIIGVDDKDEPFHDFLHAPEMQRSWKDPGSYRRRQQENEAPQFAGNVRNSYPGHDQHDGLGASQPHSRLSAASAGLPPGPGPGAALPQGIDNPAFRDSFNFRDNPAFRDSLAQPDDRSLPPRADPRFDQRLSRTSDNFSQPPVGDFGRDPRQQGRDLQPGSRYSGADPRPVMDPGRGQGHLQGSRPGVPGGVQNHREPSRPVDDTHLPDSGRSGEGSRSSLSPYGSHAGSQGGHPQVRQGQGAPRPRPKSDYDPKYVRDRPGQPRDSSFESGQSRDSRSRFSDAMPASGPGYPQPNRGQQQFPGAPPGASHPHSRDSHSSGSMPGFPDRGREGPPGQGPPAPGWGAPPQGHLGPQAGYGGQPRDGHPGSRGSRLSDTSPQGSNFSPGSAGSAGFMKRNPGLKVDLPNNRWAPGPESQRGGGAGRRSEEVPGRPPMPAAYRLEIVQEMAKTKTPNTSADMLAASQNSMLRTQEPTYFQYPTPREPPSDQQARQGRPDVGEGGGRNPNSLPRGEARPLPPAQSEARPPPPAQSEARPPPPAQSEAQLMRAAFGRVQSFHQDRKEDLYASSRQNVQQQTKRPIGTVPEDPDMPDSQVIETNLKDLAKKYPLNGNRLRMSICADDLVGKTHDELVLLLIQLRRNQSALEKARDYYRQLLEPRRPQERQYRRHRGSSGDSPGQASREQEEEHQLYTELRRQQEEIDNKLEVYRPLISLVDNMVTMGSLYGGDNLMLASEYRKHLLRPDQYRAPKQMIQWSRQRQEQKVVQGLQREVQELSAEEVDLEEKLERLYVLDRRLQEQSFKVTSFREDKELLERTLAGILKRQDQCRNNPREMSRLVTQQITIEKEISRVTQQLADASRELEETTAESNKLEHEVALLRTKVHGELTRSRSAPSLASESVLTKQKMEKDLARVQDMMQGLSQEGARLSNAMNTLRRSSSGTQLASLLDADKEDGTARRPGSYLQTDVDTLESVDLAASRLDGSSLSDSRSAHDLSSISTPSRESASQTPRDSARSGDLPRISHQRQESTLAPGLSSMEDGAEDDGQAAWDISEADENTKRFFGILPRERPKSLTVRDVKRASEQRKDRDKMRKGPEDGQDSDTEPSWQSGTEVARIIHIPYPSKLSQSVGSGLSNLGRDGAHLYENLPRAESTPAISPGISSTPAIAPGISSTPSSRRSSLSLLAPKPFKPYESKIGNSTAKPFSSEGGAAARPFKTSSEMFAGFRPVSMQSLASASSFSSLATPRPFHRDSGSVPSHLSSVGKSSRGRYLTISSTTPLVHQAPPPSMDTLHSSTAGDLISNRPIDDVPDIVKSSTAKTEDGIDEYTIEREILYRPEKVLIPERYVPDSDEEDLTEEERMRRSEKAEKIKKILAQQSMHSISQPDISRLAGPGLLHERLEMEKQRRANLLSINQQLAKQVTLKSKRDADRRKTWSGDQIAEAMKQHQARENQVPQSARENQVPQSARGPYTEKFSV